MGTKAKAMNRGCGGRCIISARELETIVVGFLFFFFLFERFTGGGRNKGRISFRGGIPFFFERVFPGNVVHVCMYLRSTTTSNLFICLFIFLVFSFWRYSRNITSLKI